jgi:hypothetical protein
VSSRRPPANVVVLSLTIPDGVVFEEKLATGEIIEIVRERTQKKVTVPACAGKQPQHGG